MNFTTVIDLIKLRLIPALYILYAISLLCSNGGMETFSWLTFILVILVSVYDYFKNDQKPIIPVSPLNKWVFITILALFASVLFSPYLGQTERPMSYYWEGLGTDTLYYHLMIFVRFVDYKKVIKYISIFITPIVLLYMFMSVVISSIKDLSKINWVWDFSRGIQGFFVMYIEYANIFELHFFILLGIALYSKIKNKNYKFWLYASLAIVLFSLFVCGSRAPYMAIPLGLMAMLAMSKSRKALFNYLSVFIVLGAVGYKTNSFIQHKAKFTVDNIKTFGDASRYGLWKTHLSMFKEHPILGVGYEIAQEDFINLQHFNKLGIKQKDPALYRWLLRTHKKAHNMFIYMLSSTGIIGFMAFMLVLGTVVFMLIRLRKWIFKNIEGINTEAALADINYDLGLLMGLTSAWATVFANMIFDTNFANLRMGHNIIFVMGLTAFLYSKYKKFKT